MAMKPAPLDVILNASDALDGGQPWYCGEGRVSRNNIAQTVLSGVPDGWAKVNGRWVELEKPELHRIPYDLVEADWGLLNAALMDGRIRILPEDFNCVCDDDGPCARHAADPTTSAPPATAVSDSPQGQ